MKLPYIQLFPNDWLNDLNLKMCSLAAQGLWMRMCCVMTQGDPYGHLKVKGRVIPTDKLAEAVGVKVDEILPLIRELEEFDVFSRDADGAIYSRRLVRDDQKRQTCVTNGLKGGNPAIKKTKGKPLLNEGISQGLTGALSHGLNLSSSSFPSPEFKDIPATAIAHDPEKAACLEAINKRFPTWCLSGKEWGRLLDYGEALSWPALRKAVDICLGSGSTDIRFYNGICKRWDEQSVKSLEDAEIAQAKFEAQKQRAKERAAERTQAKDKTPRAFSSLQIALEQAEREEREAGANDQG